LVGNTVRDLSVDVLGTPSPFPFFLAPVGVLSIAHSDGELAPAHAAAALRVPFILSSAASHSIEEIAVAMGDAPRWVQLYWVSDREVVEDAVRAFDAGVDGIVVSNDGGRQVDGAIASLDALVEVRGAVGPDAPVLMDGGIRGGADVLKALALGANAVLLGRPYVYGLAVGGQPGVEAVLQQLAAETDLTLALIGGTVARELGQAWIAASS